MSSAPPLVSILIPAYGVAAYIGTALESVFTQDFSGGVEVIVVNDGSPDTEELEKAIAPFRDRIIYRVQANAGPSAARNTAFGLSHAPLIALLDGDDAYLPDYLKIQTEFLAAHPDVVLVYGDMEVFGGTARDGVRLSRLNNETEPPTLESLISATATVINTPMIRRAAIAAAGGWDEGTRHCEDYDLWVRIARIGRLHRHSRLVARYRVRADSLSSNGVRMLQGRIFVFRKLLKDPSIRSGIISLVNERFAATQSDIALESGKQAFREGNFPLAAASVSKAAEYRHNLRLSVIAYLLRVFPGLLYAVARLRARLLARYRDV